jgi:hypothetical protein
MIKNRYICKLILKGNRDGNLYSPGTTGSGSGGYDDTNIYSYQKCPGSSTWVDGGMGCEGDCDGGSLPNFCKCIHS